MVDSAAEDASPLPRVFVPRVDARVTLLYPSGWSKNFPEKRVGTIMQVEEASCFHVCVQPNGHTVFVDPPNYAEHGATYRAWKVKDGWPVDRTPSPADREREKKKRKGG